MFYIIQIYINIGFYQIHKEKNINFVHFKCEKKLLFDK